MRIFILQLLFSLTAFAQPDSWSFLSNASSVYDIIDNGDSIICNTNSGLIAVNKTTFDFRIIDTPNDKIYSRGLCADTSGNLWISLNANGVYSFNNNSWNSYNTSNSPISSDYIYTLKFFNGNIWAPTAIGLNYFDGTSWSSFTRSNSGIPSDNIIDVASGSDGIIWVATDEGIGKYVNSNWTTFDTSNSPFNVQYISAIDVDDSNHVWISTLDQNLAGSPAAKIFKYDGLNWIPYPTAIYPGDQINVIRCASNNLTYFGSRTSFVNGWFSNSLTVFNGTTWIYYNSSNSQLDNTEIWSIETDLNGALLIGTEKGYLYTFNAGTFQNIKVKNCEIPSNIVKKIAVAGNKIYSSSMSRIVQSDQEFLSYFDGSIWHQIDTIDETCRFIKFKNDSTAYAAYGTELHCLIGGVDSVITDTSFGYIMDMCVDLSGNIWLATSNGISKFENGSWSIYNTSNSGLPDNYVNNIVASENNIWASTLNGITFFNNNSWTVYDTLNSSLLPGYLNSMCLTGSSLFLGPFQQSGWPITFLGIQKIDLINDIPFSWNSMDSSNSNLPNNEITDIEADVNDVWISTTAGILHLDTTEYSTFNSQLLNNYVYDIALNSNNQVWFATDKMISILTLDSTSNFIYESEQSLFRIFPNPAQNYINIKSEMYTNSLQYKIYDHLGKLILEDILSGSSPIKINGLSKGIYIIQIYSNDNLNPETHTFTKI